MKNYTTSWIDDRMPYQIIKTTLSAKDFNAVRLGILRLGSPLTFNLNQIKGLRSILDDHAWVFVDRYVDDMPLLAWTNFESRSALNTTIECELRLYHFKADLLVDRALELVHEAIDERLQMTQPVKEQASVTNL